MLCVFAHGPQHLKISRTCRKHWKAPEQRSGLQDIEFRSGRWTISTVQVEVIWPFGVHVLCLSQQQLPSICLVWIGNLPR